MNVFMIVQRVLMPASSAASGLPPRRRSARPKRNRRPMNATTSITPIMCRIGFGIPDSIPPGGTTKVGSWTSLLSTSPCGHL